MDNSRSFLVEADSRAAHKAMFQPKSPKPILYFMVTGSAAVEASIPALFSAGGAFDAGARVATVENEPSEEGEEDEAQTEDFEWVGVQVCARGR